jgi:hypothetical protein
MVGRIGDWGLYPIKGSILFIVVLSVDLKYPEIVKGWDF